MKRKLRIWKKKKMSWIHWYVNAKLNSNIFPLRIQNILFTFVDFDWPLGSVVEAHRHRCGRFGARFPGRSNRTRCRQRLVVSWSCTRYTVRRNTSSATKIWFFSADFFVNDRNFALGKRILCVIVVGIVWMCLFSLALVLPQNNSVTTICLTHHHLFNGFSEKSKSNLHYTSEYNNCTALHTLLMMTAESMLSKRPVLRFTAALLFLVEFSWYSRYYAETCNEWRVHLVGAVATVPDLFGPGIELLTSRTHSVSLTTELFNFMMLQWDATGK